MNVFCKQAHKVLVVVLMENYVISAKLSSNKILLSNMMIVLMNVIEDL